MKSWQVLGNDVKQVIWLPKQPLSIDYLGNADECRLEGLDSLPVALAERCKHHSGKIEAQCAWVQLRSIAE
ncbi:hypothetical protein D3C73_1606910 [compost metagenome]